MDIDKKILVTGASGFLGKQCIDFLISQDYEVHAISSKKMADESKVTWHQVDLLDSNQVSSLLGHIKVSSLLHLAWYVAPGSWYSAHENFLWLQSSLELLRQFEAAGGKRVVMVGSGTEYDWNYGYCVEGKTPLNPNTYYGQCKRILSEALIEFSKQKELQSSWARVFFVYGPGEPKARLISSVINTLLDGEEAKCTHGNQVRDFLHVSDVAGALVTILGSQHEGAINVASGEPVTLKQLANRAAIQLNQEGRIHFGAIEAPPTDLPFVVANVEPLLNLGWERKFDHDTGIADSIKWWEKFNANARG